MSNSWLTRKQLGGEDFCYYLPISELNGSYSTTVMGIAFFQGYKYCDVNFDYDYLYCVIRHGIFYNVKEN